MFRRFRILLAAGMFVSVAAMTSAAEPRNIGWEDLLPAIPSYEDPFLDLDYEQLSDLAALLRLETQQMSDGSTETQQEANQVREKLMAQGLDPDWFFEQRKIVMEHRRNAAEQLNDDIVGQSVRLPGYLLPLNLVNRKAVEFLLVPSLGACIHTPPPPPNQIVFVRFEEGFEIDGLYEPVWVTGAVKAQRQVTELSYVDGEADIDVGYAIDAQVVEIYQ